jgi:predicted AAA+ superfamily ATPase
VNRDDYSEDALTLARQYLLTLAGADISYPDGKRRNPAKVQRLLHSLARNNATVAKDSTLQRDTESEVESESVSRASVLSYLDSLKRLFVLEEIPAWNPMPRSNTDPQLKCSLIRGSVNTVFNCPPKNFGRNLNKEQCKTKIRSAPKRLLTDPSLAAAALGTSPERLLFDLNTFGFLFEGLCLRDLAVYADAMDASLYHYRDNSGLEVDAVVETRDGDWGAFEIKLGAHRVDEAAGSLLRMRKKMTGNGVKAPACMVVLTGGGLGRRREDGVSVVPINGLRP